MRKSEISLKEFHNSLLGLDLQNFLVDVKAAMETRIFLMYLAKFVFAFRIECLLTA